MTPNLVTLARLRRRRAIRALKNVPSFGSRAARVFQPVDVVSRELSQRLMFAQAS